MQRLMQGRHCGLRCHASTSQSIEVQDMAAVTLMVTSACEAPPAMVKRYTLCRRNPILPQGGLTEQDDCGHDALATLCRRQRRRVPTELLRSCEVGMLQQQHRQVLRRHRHVPKQASHLRELGKRSAPCCSHADFHVAWGSCRARHEQRRTRNQTAPRRVI